MGAFRNTCKTRPEAQRAPPSDQQWSRCRIRSFRSKNDWRLVHLRIAPLLAEASSANPHLHLPPECAPLQTSGIGHQSTLVPSLASRWGSACREGYEQNALACAEELLVEARCTRTPRALAPLGPTVSPPRLTCRRFADYRKHRAEKQRAAASATRCELAHDLGQSM
jgi:hypothetical protein